VNVVLIYPEIPDTFWSFKHALKFIRKKAASPPLGLLTVAAMLPPDWGKKLMDLNVTAWSDEILEWADCAFVSGMVVQRESAMKVIARCKSAGLTVVAGGPLFTSEPEHFPQVDHFVLNEAEITLPQFLRDWGRNEAKPVYTTQEFADLTQTPRPQWDLLTLKRYASMNIQYSRGCPYQCEFCNVTALFGHHPRTKSSGQIIAELEALCKLGWRSPVFFVDDNLIGNKKRLKTELLPALIEWQKGKKGISFYTEASINLADDDELLQMMVDAGFNMVFIGIETPDSAGLKECSKHQNQGRDLVADVKHIQRAGLQVQGGFIVGFDSDTPHIFQRQIEFIQKSGIVTAMVGLLQAMPGTKLYERLKHEGRLLGQATGDNVDGTTNILPRMSLDTLSEGYRMIMNSIYSPKQYYQRLRTFLREYKAPKIRTPLQFFHLFGFLNSVVRIGIFGRERWYYWRLLLWTQLHCPKAFPLAVTLAVYGHHFRKVCQTHLS